MRGLKSAKNDYLISPINYRTFQYNSIEISKNETLSGTNHLRYYIIDLRALLFMFNLSQASASTVGPIGGLYDLLVVQYIY